MAFNSAINPSLSVSDLSSSYQTNGFSPRQFSENMILILTFWGYGQFGPYILVTINLVPLIFNLRSIWNLPLTH